MLPFLFPLLLQPVETNLEELTRQAYIESQRTAIINEISTEEPNYMQMCLAPEQNESNDEKKNKDFELNFDLEKEAEKDIEPEYDESKKDTISPKDIDINTILEAFEINWDKYLAIEPTFVLSSVYSITPIITLDLMSAFGLVVNPIFPYTSRIFPVDSNMVYLGISDDIYLGYYLSLQNYLGSEIHVMGGTQSFDLKASSLKLGEKWLYDTKEIKININLEVLLKEFGVDGSLGFSFDFGEGYTISFDTLYSETFNKLYNQNKFNVNGKLTVSPFDMFELSFGGGYTIENNLIPKHSYSINNEMIIKL